MQNVQRRPPATKITKSSSTPTVQSHVTNQAIQYAPNIKDSKSTNGNANNIIITAPICHVGVHQQQTVWTATSTISDARHSEDIYIAPATPRCEEVVDEEGYCDFNDDKVEDEDDKNDDEDDDEFVTATQAIAWQDKSGHTDPNTSTKNIPSMDSVVTPTAIFATGTSNLGNNSGNTVRPQSLVSIKTSLDCNFESSIASGQSSRIGLKRSSPVNGMKDITSLPSDAKKSAHSPSPILWTSYPTKMNVSKSRNNSEFKTPLAPGSRKSPFNTNSSMKTPPNSPNLPPHMLQGKITPPMCDCGRRAKKNNVVSPGPNQGRGFYSCPNRKGGQSSESALQESTNRRRKQGCGYFKWESVVIKEKLAVASTPVTNYKQTMLTNKSPLVSNKCTLSMPMIGYRPTPSPVGRLGESYIGAGNVRLGTGGRMVGRGKRLGMSKRSVLKQPTLN